MIILPAFDNYSSSTKEACTDRPSHVNIFIHTHTKHTGKEGRAGPGRSREDPAASLSGPFHPSGVGLLFVIPD